MPPNTAADGTQPEQDFCPVCSGQLPGSCNAGHSQNFWESLGPTGEACPICRELLADGSCPSCSYEQPDGNVIAARRNLTDRVLAAGKAVDNSWSANLLIVPGCVAGLGLLFSALSFVYAVFGGKGYRGLDLSGRIVRYREIYEWLMIAVAVSAVLFAIGCLVHRMHTAQLRQTIVHLRKELDALPPACIRLYTTPLTAERIGAPDKVQARQLLQNSPRSQGSKFEAA